MLDQLKEQVWKLHLELPRNGLVVWTGGNVSARDPESGLVVIKPSGVLYDELQPEDHVVVNLEGEVVEGKLKPSSDTASHLYIYRYRPDVNGVVHTHSSYATAFAALGRSIPVYLTAIADEFGGPIPCAGFALIGGAEIGREVVENIGESSAVLLKHHGVFTVGATARAAVKTAVMVEDVARAVWLALQLGQPDEIAPEDVAKLHYRYMHVYGPATLEKVAEHSEEIAQALSHAENIPVNVVFKPVLTTPEAIRELCLQANSARNCVGLITWMHTFSPAKMWIAGLTALQKPFVHLHTQYNRDIPWSDIDMDFMNLNQSAHGDREFGFISSRMRLNRKVVVGHWQDEDVQRRVGTWARAACAWNDAQAARIARFGDNMREVAVTEGDKVEAQIRLGYDVCGYGVGDLVAYVKQVTDSELDQLVKEYNERYEVMPSLRRGDSQYQSLREGARIEIGLRHFLEEGNFKAFTTTFEDLHGLAQLPGLSVQRLMAENYGFGAEGDWKTAALVRAMKVMSAGLDGGTSFMEDYTCHLNGNDMMGLGAHMLEVCPTITEQKPSLEIHPLSIGGKADPVRLVFDAKPGPAINAALMDMGNRFRMLVNTVEVVPTHEPLPKLPVARAVWRPQPDLQTSATAWILAGGAHHTGFSQALTIEHLEDFAEIAGMEFLLINNDTTLSAFKKEIRWNDMYYLMAQGLR